MASAKQIGFVALCILPVLGACANKDVFVASKTTETFVQDFNPHYLEVLWVIDDRSPMRNYRTALVNEAKTFFTRLDSTLGVSGQYKMGITSMDGRYHPGELKPIGSPLLLGRGDGTLQQRTDFFGNILFPLLNLSTDAFNKGLAASLTALNGSLFATDARIPLVLVYLSYGDDESTPTTSLAPVEYYAQKLLDLKGGNPDLLRVYAANYLPLPAGTPPTASTRCALLNGNEIDTDPANYEARYFQLAQRLGGSVADICQPGFSNNFDLDGLQLKALSNIFSLTGYPNPSTMDVTATDNTGKLVSIGNYSYDAANRQLVFASVPPEGTTIVVTYLSQGK